MQTRDRSERLSKLSAAKQALLAKRLQGKKESGPPRQIPRRAEPDRARLSFAQQRMWFLDQLAPGNPFYNIPMAVRLSGPLNAAALERSINEIIRRHEALRTVFRSDRGEAVQVILLAEPRNLPVMELPALLTAKEREDRIREIAREEAMRPFDLAEGPLFRFILLRESREEHILLLTMHHIVSDGWSIGVFVKELAALYEAFSQDRPSPLPELPVQYADFAQWQRQWLQGEVYEKQRSYWKKQLEDVPILDLPTDRPRPDVQTFRGEVLKHVIPNDLGDTLKELCTREGVSLYMLLLTAFFALLHRYSGQHDIAVGSPVAGRVRTELEPLIGFFANTVVMRADLTGDPSFRELLHRVRKTALEAYAHQDMPFEKLVEELQPERNLSHNPLFQAMFVLQNAPMPPLKLSDVEISLLEVENESAMFDLLLSVRETAEGLEASWMYSTDLFDRSTMEEMMEHYQTLLETMAQDTGQPLSLLVSRIPPQKLCISVASTFTSDPIADSLHFWLEELGIPVDVRFSPYGQVFQELLTPTSRLSTNVEGIHLILLRLEDLAAWSSGPKAEALSRLELNTRDLSDAFRSYRSRVSTPSLVLLCPPSDRLAADEACAGRVRELEEQLAAEWSRLPGIEVIHYREVLKAYPVEQVNDAYADQIGHIPYTPEFFASLGTFVIRHLAGRSASIRAIVLDCDDTLWEGICGEDGPDGVRVTEFHQELQAFMVQQAQSGKRLCLCSRNRESDVFDVFRLHRDMPLRLHHLTSWRIDWDPVSAKIRALADELALPLDRIAYISANPVDCTEVRARCPEVWTIGLPASREEIPAFLHNLWVFSHRNEVKDRELVAAGSE